MFNDSNIYNEGQYNSNLGFTTGSDEDISFNGFGLQNDTYCINSTNLDGLADVQIVEFDRPQLNGGFVLNRYYRDKVINFRGSIISDNENGLSQAIDDLKGGLDGVEGYLQMKFGSTYRRIKATVSNIDIPRNHYNINYITFSISFLCKEPFFSEIPLIEKSFLSKTTSFQDELVNDGTGEVFTKTNVVFNSASGVTSFDMDIEGYSVSITHNFSAGDILVLDGDTKSVTVNGVEIDYLGVFQELKKGKSIITITINGTFNIDTSILFKKAFK